MSEGSSSSNLHRPKSLAGFQALLVSGRQFTTHTHGTFQSGRLWNNHFTLAKTPQPGMVCELEPRACFGLTRRKSHSDRHLSLSHP